MKYHSFFFKNSNCRQESWDCCPLMNFLWKLYFDTLLWLISMSRYIKSPITEAPKTHNALFLFSSSNEICIFCKSRDHKMFKIDRHLNEFCIFWKSRNHQIFQIDRHLVCENFEKFDMFAHIQSSACNPEKLYRSGHSILFAQYCRSVKQLRTMFLAILTSLLVQHCHSVGEHLLKVKVTLFTYFMRLGFFLRSLILLYVDVLNEWL